jgi:hypothetical protein
MAMQKETRDLKFKLLIYLSPWLQAGSKKKEKKKNKIQRIFIFQLCIEKQGTENVGRN